MSHNNDYIEQWRRAYYPKLHGFLKLFGLYSTAVVTEHQYAATLYDITEEELEKELLHRPHHWERNPVAAFKSHPDGRKSTLSLRLTHDGSSQYEREYVAPGMQLHWTLVPSDREGGTVDIYAHYEDDWEKSPFKHLRGANLSRKKGVKRTQAFLRHATPYQKGNDWKFER